jgi:Holliday junction resolvase
VLRYSKGARGERELLNYLYGKAYSVVRSAGSGVNSISPDIIAIKHGKGLAFECKAWDRSSLSIEPEKYDVLCEWERNTGMDTFIAWRMNGQGWLFIKLAEMNRCDKSYTVTKTQAFQIGRKIEALLVD